MDVEAIARTRIGGVVIRALGAAMESPLRHRLSAPTAVLAGVEGLRGQVVLEVGCGTGYFTLPAAEAIGGEGLLVAMDLLSESVALVSRKVETAGLTNVRVVRGDALDTGLDAESFDTVLLFGVVPAPMLPLKRLLPEMRRVLKPRGTLAVWPSIPGWLPHAVTRSASFTHAGKRNGVHSFRRS